MTLLYASITVEIREVFLGNKPQALLEVSSKATVPVLLCDGQVLDESLDIMLWALRPQCPQHNIQTLIEDLPIAQ